ncbi:E3 ubiquitin-protein ligase RNF181 isoform X2 [Stegostoma tigrinum]|uniref:E3 ubiquitin-protein ligase RNF181 isoform X2 n=1 Tax=Stegostoma tigrinum TaxID=3053191 RepID=UPI00202B93F8|nr:E3 ubiquitin-protein ligase RNF181 isoform X2 [Stegostoma tigrinum]
MASYFEEHGCEGAESGEQEGQDGLLLLARSLLAGIDLDLGQVDFSDWDHRLPPAAKKEIVQNLPTVPVTAAQADKGAKCPVCLLEFEEEEMVKKMPCEHFFHSGCLVPWLGKTNSCPLCRLELPTDNPEYEEYKQDKERRKQKEHRLEYLHGAMYT